MNFIFWPQLYWAALTGTVLLYVVMLILGRMKENKRILLLIRGSRKTERQIESVVFEYLSARAALQTINPTEEAVKLTYDIPGRVYDLTVRRDKSISDLLYKIEGMESVKITHQKEKLMD